MANLRITCWQFSSLFIPHTFNQDNNKNFQPDLSIPHTFSQRNSKNFQPQQSDPRMSSMWERGCQAMMALNVLLMVATLTVSVVLFTQIKVPPPTCPPAREKTLAGGTVPAPSPAAGSDVIARIRNLTKQAVEKRQLAFQEAKYFKTKKPTGQKAFAHVVLGTSQNNSWDANLLWDSQHNMSLRQEVRYLQEGYLQVPETGYYFVFVSLHYMERPGHGFDRDILRDYIYRTEGRFLKNPTLREKTKKMLLFNKQTPCIVVPHAVPLASSYQGAVVYLNRNDMLSVRTNLPDTLHPESARSYFGLYLV